MRPHRLLSRRPERADRSRWATALLTLAALAAISCADPVRRARSDMDSWEPFDPSATLPPPPPPELSLAEGDQVCEFDAQCVVARGLPGQRLEALCCATCDAEAIALNTEHAAHLEEWRGQIACHMVACVGPGACIEEQLGVEAACIGGVCGLRSVSLPKTAPTPP
ncbi:MAG: hypothetical protein CMH57_09425 [Myxococcales bacterium]|nr:hypothetical protein [Myxococcales bacterium]